MQILIPFSRRASQEVLPEVKSSTNGVRSDMVSVNLCIPYIYKMCKLICVNFGLFLLGSCRNISVHFKIPNVLNVHVSLYCWLMLVSL